MTKQTVTSLALAAGCALALAVPAAQAQTRVFTNGPAATPGDFSSSAARNNAESREYMRLLQTNRGFREARMRKECGPITDTQLHANCLASFDRYTPFAGGTRLAGNAWYPPNPASRGTPSTEMMTGGSTGAMTSTTGARPDAYGTGYGSSSPTTSNYTTQSNYPEPRPSAPLSGGGAASGM